MHLLRNWLKKNLKLVEVLQAGSKDTTPCIIMTPAVGQEVLSRNSHVHTVKSRTSHKNENKTKTTKKVFHFFPKIFPHILIVCSSPDILGTTSTHPIVAVVRVVSFNCSGYCPLHQYYDKASESILSLNTAD